MGSVSPALNIGTSQIRQQSTFDKKPTEEIVTKPKTIEDVPSAVVHLRERQQVTDVAINEYLKLANSAKQGN